nr:MAG TPA: hypothetical protein [Bacteriophage sp.]
MVLHQNCWKIFRICFCKIHQKGIKFKPLGNKFLGAFRVILYQIRNNKNILVSHTLVTILKF